MENKFEKAETMGSIGCAERRSRSLDLIAVNVGEGVEEGDPVKTAMPGSAGLTN